MKKCWIMGIAGLDSLAQMSLNNIYVCSSCGLLLNYKSDYQGHHAVNNCPAKGKKQPVDGETYPIAKYQHYGTQKGGVAFTVIDRQNVVYHAPKLSEEELLRMNNLFPLVGMLHDIVPHHGGGVLEHIGEKPAA